MVEFLPVGHSEGLIKWGLSKEQRRKAQRLLLKYQKERGMDDIQFENRYIVSEQENTKILLANPHSDCDFYNFGVGCISGIYSYMITAQGRVATGCLIQEEVGNSNLLKRSLRDIWNEGKLFQKLRNRENLKGKCGQCVYRYVCGGCRRSAFIQTGDFMGPDPNCWVEESTLSS
jgi:radical SAM protein with 4Fe4S-binding SPASM domain